MIKRDRLAGGLKKIKELEERLVPLLNKYVSSSLFLSPLKKSDRDSLLAGFQKIALSVSKHAEILDGINNEISKGKADVY